MQLRSRYGGLIQCRVFMQLQVSFWTVSCRCVLDLLSNFVYVISLGFYSAVLAVMETLTITCAICAAMVLIWPQFLLFPSSSVLHTKGRQIQPTSVSTSETLNRNVY